MITIARKISATMGLQVSVDVLKATNTIKDFNQVLKSTSSAWKGQEASERAAGNSLGALKAKYDGIGSQIKTVKEKITALKDQQEKLTKANGGAIGKYKEYQTTIENLRSKQEGLDTSTKEGKEQYEKLATQITKTQDEQKKNANVSHDNATAYNKLTDQIGKAETKLAGFTRAQDKTKSSMKYYESGLHDLQHSYKLNTSASEAYVDRLKAEGRNASATVAKYKGLQDASSNLREQYKKQVIELKDIATQSGKTSDAYKIQKTRVDKTKTSFEETNNKMKSMNGTMRKLSPTGIKKIDDATVRMKDHTGAMVQKVKDGYHKMSGAINTAGIAIGVASGAMYKGAKMASTLQNTYKENTNLLVTSGEKTKEVTKEISDMQKDGKKYSVEYGESQHNIAKGYQELVKRGYDGKQSLGAMKSILQASKASGDDFDDTMKVTTSTLEAFGMRTSSTAGMMKNTKKVANELAMAADATSTDFASLGVGMNYVGTTAHTAGLSLAQTSSAMGVLSNSGLEAQQAGTGLRKILISLQTPTDNGAAAFKKYGMSISDFKDKSGKLKPVGDIFQEIGDKVPKGEQANFFHNVFGTTGQNAAAILATNTDELKKVNKQVEGAYKNDYVSKLANKNMKSTQNATKQAKQAINGILINLGQALMPAISKAAGAFAKAFNDPKFQKGLKVIADGIGKVANKAIDLVEWMGSHTKDIKTFGEVLLAVFAGTKIVNGIAHFKTSLSTINGLFGTIGSTASKGSVSSEMESVAGSAEKANVSAGGMSGKFKAMPGMVKGLSGAMAALPAAIDLGGSIAKTINTPTTKNKVALESKSLGTGIGAIAGGLIGGPVGAGIGASVGDQLGSSKTAQDIVKKMNNGISKAMKGNKVTVEAPRISTKKAKSDMSSYSKTLEKQQLHTVKVLHDSGNMTDAEYKKQVASIKDTYNKKKKKATSKIDSELADMRARNATNTYKYKKLQKEKREKLDKIESDHKKAIGKLNIKYANNDMTKEAKAHMTLTGKIQTESNKQGNIAKKLGDKKKKLSWSTVQKLVKDANTEYNKVTSMADKKYNKVAKAADKQRAKVVSAADSQYKKTKADAEKQYNDTVNAAKNQYKGNSKWAKEQRQKVTDNAKDQKNKTISAAKDQKQKTIDHADKQRQGVIDKATKEHDDTINKANSQKKSITNAAKDRSKGVSKHSVRQANNAMKAASSQGKGENSIWQKILDMVNSVYGAFGMKKLKMHNNGFKYTPASDSGAYATGGGITKDEMALVGEAGPELRYTPYSGKVDIIGKSGAQFVPVKKGQKILNASDTKKVMSGSYKGNLPGYAKGTTTIEDFLKSAKDDASSLWDNVKDLSKGVLSVLKDPVGSLTGIVTKNMGLMTKVKGAHPSINDVAKSAFKKGISNIGDKLKELYQDYLAQQDDGGSFDGKMGAHGVYKYLWDIASKAMKKFGMIFTSGYRPGDRYYHGKHQAVDIAFPGVSHSSRYWAPANWVFDHFKKKIGYVITQGKIKTRGQFNRLGSKANGWSTWMDHDHYDHLHINGMWGPNDVGSGGGGKVTGSHKSLLKKAGFRANEIAAADWIVNVESSWNPNAVNPSSGAFGLAQSLGHGMAGHGSPLSQLKWMAGYIHGRYGNANKAKSFHKSHNWYANGGIVDKEQLAHIAENNQPEAIIPLSKMKRAQATKVLDDVRARFSDDDSVVNGGVRDIEGQIKELTDVVSDMKDLVAMILNVNSNTLQATKDGAFDKTKFYKKQAKDMNLQSYQGF